MWQAKEDESETKQWSKSDACRPALCKLMELIHTLTVRPNLIVASIEMRCDAILNYMSSCNDLICGLRLQFFSEYKISKTNRLKSITWDYTSPKLFLSPIFSSAKFKPVKFYAKKIQWISQKKLYTWNSPNFRTRFALPPYHLHFQCKFVFDTNFLESHTYILRTWRSSNLSNGIANWIFIFL